MRIFSGIQPTGRKHLGNYIGAITQYVAGQDRGEAIYCVVDLHAITVAYEPAALRESVYDTAATLLAAGLDPDRCIFFRQSDVREHTELCWLLSSVTVVRRAQPDDPVQGQVRQPARARLGGPVHLPGAEAADVLAYRAHEVPVGDDQRQHVELMRDVAERFNARFGETLVVPEVRIPEVGARIMDLQVPGPQDVDHRRQPRRGRCYVLDEPDDDRQEVPLGGHRLRERGASAGPTRPGISNLIEILAAVRGDHARGRSRREFARLRLRRVQAGRGRRRGRLPGAGPRALRGAPRRRGRARADPRRAAPRRPARSPPTRWPTCARVMGVGPVRAAGRTSPAPLTSAPMRLVDLELDLDVFAGPFDLLLTLILREEVDLLEVDLADVVIAYIDHLEQRGRARPRGRDRVPGADRGAAGAEVAADAARRGARS